MHSRLQDLSSFDLFQIRPSTDQHENSESELQKTQYKKLQCLYKLEIRNRGFNSQFINSKVKTKSTLCHSPDAGGRRSANSRQRSAIFAPSREKRHKTKCFSLILVVLRTEDTATSSFLDYTGGNLQKN